LTKLTTATAVLLAVVLGVLGLAMLPTRDAKAMAQAASAKDGKLADPVRAGKAPSDKEKLQGVWTVTELGWDGETKPLPAGLTGRLVFEGDQYSLGFFTELLQNSQSGSLVYATFKLNSTKSPRQIDLAVSMQPKNKPWLGIYELDGDNLRLCLPEVAPFDRRPTEFKAGKGSNLKVLTLKRKRAAAPAPERKKMDFDFHKNIPSSELKIELSPAATVTRMEKKGLVLSLKITNASSDDVKTSLAHEWHGGEWPPTSLYAISTPEKGKKVRAFMPVYLAGEDPQVARSVTIAPGKSIDVELRMDWPGTGSVIGIPLVEASGKYTVQFALVFEVGGKQQYVSSTAKVVELLAK